MCGVRVSSGNGMVAGGREASEGDEVKRAVSGQTVECRCGRAVEKLESLNSLKILGQVTTLTVQTTSDTKKEADCGIEVVLKASQNTTIGEAENDSNPEIIKMCE
jgi:hypothetical protein